MKTLKLIETGVTNSQVPDFRLNYRTEFLQACEIAEQGMTIIEMGIAVRIGDKLRGADIGDDVLLEDAEQEWLASRMKARRFSIVAQEVIEMVEAVANAPRVGVRPVDAGLEDAGRSA